MLQAQGCQAVPQIYTGAPERSGAWLASAMRCATAGTAAVEVYSLATCRTAKPETSGGCSNG